MLIPGIALILLLRMFYVTRQSRAELHEPARLTWRDYRPLHRLLDPADFEFLRRRGIPEPRIQKLRAERRRIYRLCLRSLAQDFNQVQRTLNLILIHSDEDRPDLAAELNRQRVTFYRNLMAAEFRLFLHRCGLEEMPAIDLLKPLEVLQAQLQTFAPAGAAA
jgi:hypothetical protein